MREQVKVLVTRVVLAFTPPGTHEREGALTIGRGVTVRGAADGARALAVEGLFETGTLTVEQLRVAPGAVLQATDVTADVAILSGEVRCNSVAAARIVLTGTSSLAAAHVRVRSLRVEAGAQVNGHVHTIVGGSDVVPVPAG